MSKPAQFPFNLPEGFPGFPPAAKETFDSMSSAFSDWLHNANRMQAEMIRFMGDRFSKDVSLISRFASCRQPDEFLRLQAEAMSELASDFMQEGAKIAGMFSEASRESLGKVAKATGGKQST